MAQPPEKSRTAKVGSNVKAHKALVAYDARANDKRIKPLVQLLKKAGRERKAFLTKDVVRVVNDVAQSSRDAFNLALLKAKGDGPAVVRARRKARTANDKGLGQRIPGFTAFQAAQSVNAAQYQKLLAKQRAAAFDTHVNLGLGAVASDHLDDQVFSAPYPLFDVDTPGVGGLFLADRTFSDPRLGIVLNQLRFHDDEHSSIFGDFHVFIGATSSAAVGVNYTVPRSGRITCSAVVQNIYNYVTFSLTDNFGFSDGDLTFRILLFMRIIRGGQVIAFNRLIFENGLIAHSGTDLHGVSFDDIDMSTPYTFSAKTEETFAPGETVQLLVGSQLQISDHLNDMEARLDGMLGWQVKSIFARTS